ncbi:hypothetical protein BH11VER1_BH11VER1_09220 [soil metagenome]
MSYDDLMQQIREAFASVARPADDALVPHHCDECNALRGDLRGRAPNELSYDWVVRSFDQLVFMSDDAKRYYLPAYFRVAARDPESTVTQFVLYSLSDEFRFQPSGGYTPSQRQAILNFLSFIEARIDSEEKEYISKARELWKLSPNRSTAHF